MRSVWVVVLVAACAVPDTVGGGCEDFSDAWCSRIIECGGDFDLSECVAVNVLTCCAGDECAEPITLDARSYHECRAAIRHQDCTDALAGDVLPDACGD